MSKKNPLYELIIKTNSLSDNIITSTSRPIVIPKMMYSTLLYQKFWKIVKIHKPRSKHALLVLSMALWVPTQNVIFYKHDHYFNDQTITTRLWKSGKTGKYILFLLRNYVSIILVLCVWSVNITAIPLLLSLPVLDLFFTKSLYSSAVCKVFICFCQLKKCWL